MPSNGYIFYWQNELIWFVDLRLHIFDQLNHFITEKWTGQRSTILYYWEKFLHKTHIHTKQDLQSIADVMNKMQQRQFKVTSRSITDHLESLLSKFKSKTNKELKASGIEVETTGLSASLEEVLCSRSWIRY